VHSEGASHLAQSESLVLQVLQRMLSHHQRQVKLRCAFALAAAAGLAMHA
jgi:hypothetical protein